MERLRRRPEPAAIDITWVSCRGVRSSLPFHTPCLYASIFVVSSSSKNAHGHRVKTPTDRTGGENPEWDAPLRLYLPDAASPASEAANGKKDGGDVDIEDVLLVKFEIKAEVAVLGDVHTASAAVPVPDLVADRRTRRVSYQLLGPDGRQPNGVISFSYAFHDDDGQGSSDGCEPASPPCPAPTAVHSTAVSSSLPPPTVTAAAPRLYPEIDWTLTEQPAAIYPPAATANNFTLADTQFYPPAPPPAEPTSVYPPAPPVEPASVYPPVTVTAENSFCSMYPTVVEPASALYPTLDLAPVSYYYPPAPVYDVGWGDRDRCLYG